LISEARNIISEYKAGSTLFSLLPSETGRAIPSEDELHSLSASGQKLHKLDLALSFHDINITNLSIQGVTYENATFIEDVVITHISLIDGNRAGLDFFQHEEEIVFVFDHNGYDYKLIQTDKLKIKRRKPLTGYGDGIDPVRVNNPSTETLTHNQTVNTASTWPNKNVPTGTKAVEHSYGISILYLVDPRIWTYSYEGKIRTSLTVPGINETNNVLEEERLIDAESGYFFRFYTAHFVSPVTGNKVLGYVTAPPSLCPNDSCSSNFADLLARMNTNSDIRTLRNEWKADVVMLLHYVYDYRHNNWEGVAGIPSNPTDTSFKNYANAIVYYHELKTATFIHESFHLLGARHSQYESQNPGIGSVKAYIGSYKDYSQTPTENVGYRSLMSYNDVCTNVTGDQSCQWFKRLSSPSTRVTLYPQDRVFTLGSSLHNNKAQVIKLIRAVSNYSKN